MIVDLAFKLEQVDLHELIEFAPHLKTLITTISVANICINTAYNVKQLNVQSLNRKEKKKKQKNKVT